MFIPPEPVFNTPPILPRAAPDASPPIPQPEPHPTPASVELVPVVGAAGDPGSSELTSATTSTEEDGVATTSTATVPPLALATATPLPETTLATDIQQFGHRNFVGLLVLGLLALLGLVLWLSFGAWPRRVMRRVRARFSSSGKEGTGTQGPAVDLREHIDAAAAHGSREPSEKDETPSEGEEEKDKPPCSARSTELDSEVERLEKGPGMDQDTTMPRVRFTTTRC